MIIWLGFSPNSFASSVYISGGKYSVLWIQEKKLVRICLRLYYVEKCLFPSTPQKEKGNLSTDLSDILKSRITSLISVLSLKCNDHFSLAWNSAAIKAKIWFLTNYSVCQEIHVISSEPFTWEVKKPLEPEARAAATFRIGSWFFFPVFSFMHS